MIHELGWSVETIEEPQSILTSLQEVHQDTGQIWDTLKSIEHNEVPCLIWINAPNFAFLLKKPKV